MVFGEFKETLFWNDIPLLLENERVARVNDDFIRRNIPTKTDFLAQIENYVQNGEPKWVSGRNPCCDDLSLAQLKKAYGNQFRGPERADWAARGIASWATHIGFYAEQVLCKAQNNILELTIGAGFGTAAVVEQMHDDDFYVGVDIDFKCVKNAEGILYHYEKSGVAIATSLWNLPFDNGTFSVVCSHLGIDECREVPTILAEAARVLTPDGRLVLTCRDSGYLRTHDYFKLYGIGEREAVECLERARHYANRAQLDKILSEVGMSLIDHRQFNERYVAVYKKHA